MLFTSQSPIPDGYPVEASGWDSAQTFFVEKTQLQWNEETGKCLTLTRSLCPEAMIFVRFVHFSSPQPSLPVPYRAQHIGVTAEGGQKFRLNQIYPN